MDPLRAMQRAARRRRAEREAGGENVYAPRAASPPDPTVAPRSRLGMNSLRREIQEKKRDADDPARTLDPAVPTRCAGDVALRRENGCKGKKSRTPANNRVLEGRGAHSTFFDCDPARQHSDPTRAQA